VKIVCQNLENKNKFINIIVVVLDMLFNFSFILLGIVDYDNWKKPRNYMLFLFVIINFTFSSQYLKHSASVRTMYFFLEVFAMESIASCFQKRVDVSILLLL
jgi:hypothetical protein